MQGKSFFAPKREAPYSFLIYLVLAGNELVPSLTKNTDFYSFYVIVLKKTFSSVLVTNPQLSLFLFNTNSLVCYRTLDDDDLESSGEDQNEIIPDLSDSIAERSTIVAGYNLVNVYKSPVF